MKKIWIFILFFLLCINVCFAFSLDDADNPFAGRFKYSFNSSDLIKDYQNFSQYSVQILENGKAVGAGEKISFFLNGVNYTRTTNSDGVATLNINLPQGKYIVYCEYRSYKNYNNILIL